MEGKRVIMSEGNTLNEAIEKACQELAIPKQSLQYRLCAEHFRFGADTVKIEAWTQAAIELDDCAFVEDLLKSLLQLMSFQNDVDVQLNGDGIRAALKLEDTGAIAGRLREVLDAMQHLVNKALVKQGSSRRAIVDLEDYREKHDQSVRYVAQKVCEKVLSEGCVVTLKPMNAYDRRLVHLEVARYQELGSRSNGTRGQMKRVQVFPRHRSDDDS